MRFFYSHLIEIETLASELDQMELSKEEKSYLATLADANIHQAIMDAILSELSPQEKIILLEHLKNNNHDKLWDLLNRRVDNIETKIKSAAEQVKDELKGDIKEAQKMSNGKSKITND